jgi:hypothetical protein
VPDFTQLTIGVAALVTLVYSIRTVRGIAADNQKFLGNHMSTNTRAMQDVAVNLASLNVKADDIRDDTHHISERLDSGLPMQQVARSPQI